MSLHHVHKHGGNEPVVGGLDDLHKYGGSSKSELARGLAADMAKELKVNIKTTGDLDSVVKSMLENLPDPRKSSGNAKSFTHKADQQKDACKKLAKIVNKHLGEGTVRENASEEEICEEITEAMYSLSTDMRGELRAVQKDVDRVMSNMKSLESMLKGNYAVLKSEIGKSEDSELGAKTIVLEKVHESLLEEISRQQKILARILEVQIPEGEKDVATVLKDNKEFKTLVRKIKAQLGEKKFGEKVALTISGIGRTAAEAVIVEKALKNIGMSVDEYKNIKSFAELKESLAKTLQKDLSGKGADALDKYMKAADALMRFQHHHDEIVEELKTKKGGDEVTGGIKMTKELEKRGDVRKRLLGMFNTRMGGYIQQIMASTESLAEGVGAKRIPVNEDLVKFTKMLDLVPSLNERYNYYSLTGYNTSIQAKEYRENFLSSVKHVIAAIDKLESHKDYKSLKQLKDMRNGWTGFVELVRDFSDKFAEGLGKVMTKRGEDDKQRSSVDITKPITGADETIDGPEIARVAYNLDRTKAIIKYYVRIGLIQNNMMEMSKGSGVSEIDYKKVLGDAVAALRDKNVEIKNTQTKLISTGGTYAVTDEKVKASIKETIDLFRKADDQMLLVAEAVELYLTHFTDALVANPNSIEELHTMLKTTDSLSKWYSAQSGNMICKVFEGMDVSSDLFKQLNDKANKEKHYYELVSAAGGKVTDVSATRDGAEKDEKLNTKSLFKSTHEVFDNVLALKNLMSIFFHIGDKFGGESLRKKIHMRPVEIYNGLVDYMTRSSFEFEGDADTEGKKGFSTFKQIKLRVVGERKYVDCLFEYCIKSIVAKVLTVIGTYNMLNRPVDANGLGYQTDLRLTLGAAESVPAVYDEALELYIRIPLLAEWYRDLFKFWTQKLIDNKTVDAAKTLSMIPEVEGVYSGLVHMIFDVSRHNDSGYYNEGEARVLIHEINKIFNHHKSASDPVSASIHGLVNEINRRYGILVAEQRKLWKDEYNKRYMVGKETDPTGSENINYEILPDGEDTYPRAAAPSDTYMQSMMGDAEPYTLKHKFEVGNNHRNYVYALRYAVQKKLEGAKPDAVPSDKLDEVRKDSFTGAIRARSEELKNSKSEDQRYKVVLNALNAFGEFSYSAIERSVVMFHETVVAGLESLCLLYNTCQEYNTSISGMASSTLDIAGVVNLVNVLHQYCEKTNLVDVKIETVMTGPDSKSTLSIYIDHSKLKEVVEKQIAFIKIAIDRFRGLLPKDVIETYEKIGNSNTGSVYDLEHKFLNKLIYGRTDPSDEENVLDMLTTKVRKAIAKVTKLDDSGAAIKTYIKEANAVSDLATSGGLTVFLQDVANKPKNAAATRLTSVAKAMFDLKDPVCNKTAVINRFNCLLAMYLREFYNEANERIYASVINHVSNSAFSEEVVKVGGQDFSNVLDDSVTVTEDIDGNVLAKSLAVMLYQIMNGKLPGQRELYFLENDLSEVPEYMREKFRGLMPYYSRLFCEIQCDAETLKQLSKLTGGNVNQLKSLDKVIAGCESVCKCIKTVLGEVGDSPMFFETKQMSIKDYETINHKHPLMPLSLTSVLLNRDVFQTPKGFPGSNNFKVLYGFRGLCGDLKFKQVPGMLDIYQRHNETSEGEYHFKESEIEQFFENQMHILNYLIHLKQFRGVPLFKGSCKTTWASNKSNDDLVGMVESVHQNEQRLKFIQHVQAKEENMVYGSRSEIRSKNIIDLNITPININALRSEVPFVNLYNYSYTFDSMICDLLDVSKDIISDNNFAIISELSNAQYANARYGNEHIRKLMALLTVHPYVDLTMSASASTAPMTTVSTPPQISLSGDKKIYKSSKSGETMSLTKEEFNKLVKDGAVLTEVRKDNTGDEFVAKKDSMDAKVDNTGDTNTVIISNVQGTGEFSGGKVVYDSMVGKNVAQMFAGSLNLEGLGRPKFLSEELFNKALFGTVITNEKGASPLKDSLKYLKKSDNSTSRNVAEEVKGLNVANLKQVGMDRFDTWFVRHLLWIVNIQRLLRVKMHRDLLWHTTKITKDISVLAPGNTEMFDSDVADSGPRSEEKYTY